MPVMMRLALIVAAIAMGEGCTTSPVPTPNNAGKAAPLPVTTNDEFGDLKRLAEEVNSDLLSSSIFAEKPILVVMGIENRTDEPFETKIIADTIRTKLINCGKASFIDESLRDAWMMGQGYQLANCSPETQTVIGKKLGARYMLTGSLIKITKAFSIPITLSKKGQAYLQLTIEVTDLQTGLIASTTQKARLQSAQKIKL
ncbi:MAG: hypothetical protein WCO42_00350 [bacterium]